MDRNDVDREYKNNLFCDLFSEKKNALSLYNALNHTEYTNVNDLEIVTLSDVIFMQQKNDVGNLKSAVEKAIDRCIQEDLLKSYLLKKKAEVELMLLTEFNQEVYERVIREESRAEGWEEGREEGEERVNRLHAHLISEKRFDELERAVKDRQYQAALYKEYGL